MTIYDKLAKVVLADLTSLNMITAIVALSLGFGFMFANADNENYKLVTDAAPTWVWGSLFLIYGIVMIGNLFIAERFILKLITGVSGLFLWVYVFLSFVVFDPTPVYSTELMLAIPIVAQTWLLAETLFKKR